MCFQKKKQLQQQLHVTESNRTGPICLNLMRQENSHTLKNAPQIMYFAFKNKSFALNLPV